MQRLRRGSSTDDWCTPPSLWAELPNFDLDPAVPEVGGSPSWAKVKSAYTPSQDGLSQPWEGHVWLNPPYSKPAPWLERLSLHGDGMALIFARTETGWWQEHVWPKADLLLFLRGRLSFVRAEPSDEIVGHNAPAPSALVAYGSWAANHLRRLAHLGALARPEVGDTAWIIRGEGS